MNRPTDFDNESVRREWQAQERALHEERHEVDVADAEVRVAQYRLITRVLRRATFDAPPRDFAAYTAARIESMEQAADERFEIWLQRTLLMLLGLASVVVAVIYGSKWLDALAPSLSASVRPGSKALIGWGLVAALCLWLSSTIERWRQRAR